MTKIVGLYHKILSMMIPHYGTVYRRIGGKKIIDSFVDDFYHIMSTDPVAKDCLATHHGGDLKKTALKLKEFLSGWLGGPQLYVQKYGHPRMRMRHMPFPIGVREAEQWLYCMKLALKKSSIDPTTQDEMMVAFKDLAERIINRD